MYTADNGYHTGAFGLVYDKRNPFETDTHLPLLMRGPGIAPGTVSAAPVAMTDLSATLLDMAGVARPPLFDGLSALPYARAAPPAPRLATFIEYVGEGGGGGGPDPACAATRRDDTLMCNTGGNYTLPPFYYGGDFCMCQDARNNTYTCLRYVEGAHAAAEKAQMLSATGLPHAPAAAADWRYCEFSDARGTVEFFDLTKDPYELQNTAGSLAPALRAAMAARLAALRACKGAAECAPLLSTPVAAA